MTLEADTATPPRFARGQALRLPKHSDHCSDPAELDDLVRRLRSSSERPLLAADLFSGAGGMSLGLEQAGMRVVFGADFDSDALATHAHHFAGMSVGWDLGDPERVEEVGSILRSASIDVIAGGPPCQPFSKAGRSRMRYLVQNGVRERHDKRRDLWQSYLEIVQLARPRAVIMENVPDMALDREMFILRSIVRRLGGLGLLGPGAGGRHVPVRRPTVPATPHPGRRARGSRVHVARGVHEEGHARQRDPRPPTGRPQGRVGVRGERARDGAVTPGQRPSSSGRCAQSRARRTCRPGLRPRHAASTRR